MTTSTAAPATPDRKKALGRGLASLLPGGSKPNPMTNLPSPAQTGAAAAPALKLNADGQGWRELDLNLVDKNPYQTRGYLDEAAMEELVASVQASGVVQPIVVRPAGEGRYQLIAGQRRWEASRRAGKTTVPAVVRQVSDQQAMEMTIIENLQRQDLNTMEQARAFERLSRDFGLTQEQMAQRTGIDRTTVSNYISLLKLPIEVQALVEQDKVSFGHAKVLLSVNSPETIIKIATKLVEEELSVRALEELVLHLEHPPEKQSKEVHVDPNVREAQMELERVLGVRVQIRDRNGKGKIIIEYKTLKDFDRVVEVLGAK